MSKSNLAHSQQYINCIDLNLTISKDYIHFLAIFFVYRVLLVKPRPLIRGRG